MDSPKSSSTTELETVVVELDFIIFLHKLLTRPNISLLSKKLGKKASLDHNAQLFTISPENNFFDLIFIFFLGSSEHAKNKSNNSKVTEAAQIINFH